jgi:hypothetical protein
MKAKVTIEHGNNDHEWLVHWETTQDKQGQSISLRMAVPFVHPSPRVSDLERAALEQAVLIFQGLLNTMPLRHDK